MNRFKNGLWLFAFCLLGLVASDFCHQKTKGFAVGKLVRADAFPSNSSLVSALISEEELLSALDQPFYYLKRGNSAYVFLSSDRKYVLKFLKTSKIFPPFWADWKLFQLLFPSYSQELYSYKEKEKSQLLTSYLLATERLHEQTGISYLHLNPTSHLEKQIYFYDNLKIKHTLPADRIAFALQKKADPFCPYFIQLVAEGKKEEIDTLLKQFANLLQERAFKGIFDRDLSPQYNLGISEGRFITFDLDGLKPCQKPPSEAKPFEQHMLEDGKKMLLWLHSIDPRFVSFLEEEIHRCSLSCLKEKLSLE